MRIFGGVTRFARHPRPPPKIIYATKKVAQLILSNLYLYSFGSCITKKNFFSLFFFQQEIPRINHPATNCITEDADDGKTNRIPAPRISKREIEDICD